MGIDIGKRIGWKPAPNHHLVMIEPNGDCSPRGMAFQRSHAVGNYVWLSWDPNRYFLANSVATTLAHELGHNFVLGHTSLATCSPALQPACSVADEFPSETRDIEYGGDDLMGGFIDAGSRSLNPIARWQLRLLRPKDLLTIDTRLASNRRIRLVAPGRPGTQAVRIVDVEGGSSWWISFDSTPTCPFGDRQPWCLITGSSNEAVRVHVMLGPRFLPLIGQQRSDTGSMHLTVGTAYPFPGGQLTVVSLGGAATIDVTTTGP